MRQVHFLRTSVVLLSAVLAAACGASKPRGERNIQYKIEHAESPDTRQSDSNGRLADDEIRRVMEEQQGGFNNCFHQAPDAFISGHVELTFVVKATGRVEDVFVSQSDSSAP